MEVAGVLDRLTVRVRRGELPTAFPAPSERRRVLDYRDRVWKLPRIFPRSNRRRKKSRGREKRGRVAGTLRFSVMDCGRRVGQCFKTLTFPFRGSNDSPRASRTGSCALLDTRERATIAVIGKILFQLPCDDESRRVCEWS